MEVSSSSEPVFNCLSAVLTAAVSLTELPSWQKGSSRMDIPSNAKKTTPKAVKEGSNEEVLLADVRHMLSAQSLSDESESETASEQKSPRTKPGFSPPERFSEVVVKISEISSTGDGLGLASTSDHVYVVPFSIPGDIVKAKVINYFPQENYTLTDFIEVIEPAANRNDSLVKCPYFSKCSGCQFQMLSYGEQLIHKKTIVEKAYRNFSSLPPELIPIIGDTIGSPLQYGYRTKLTPHFDGSTWDHESEGETCKCRD